jgi:hypothetical protein
MKMMKMKYFPHPTLTKKDSSNQTEPHLDLPLKAYCHVKITRDNINMYLLTVQFSCDPPGSAEKLSW